MAKKLCYNCFSVIPIYGRTCTMCGLKNTDIHNSAVCLPPGTVLNGKYLIGKALGVGGFGITYKCFDMQVGGVCAVKEYFPTLFANRASDRLSVLTKQASMQAQYNRIMQRFVKEAQLLQTLRHRNIVSVYDSFYGNGTAYYVMEYCDGVDLRRYTGDYNNKLEYGAGINIMHQVMDGMEYIHSKGILHRDIAPDNIYITKTNNVKILDFGSARYEMDQLNKGFSVVIKAGYAPVEQYSKTQKQGTYTDVYAFGATFYHLFTGVMPMPSTQRMVSDQLVLFSQLRPDLPASVKYCIEQAMCVYANQRIQDFTQMRRIFFGTNNFEVVHKRALHFPPFDSENNITPQVHNKASLSQRLCASIMDLLMYGSVYFAALFLLVSNVPLLEILLFAFPIFVTLINIASELAFAATPGKKIMQLYVGSSVGGKVSAGCILCRNLIKLLGVFVLITGDSKILLEDKLTRSNVYVA